MGDSCPDCGYYADDRVDAYIHVLLQHRDGLDSDVTENKEVADE